MLTISQHWIEFIFVFGIHFNSITLSFIRNLSIFFPDIMKWKLELWRKHRVENTKFLYKKIIIKKDESILTCVQHSENMIINQKKKETNKQTKENKSWLYIKIDQRRSKEKEMILTKKKKDFFKMCEKYQVERSPNIHLRRNTVVNDLNEFVAKMNLMRYWWTFRLMDFKRSDNKNKNKLRARRVNTKYEIWFKLFSIN